jgi:SAM-dependent methyltransferase
VTLSSRLLGHSVVYRTWQAPFADRKFAPIQAHNDLASVRRVLDVGCGPGTNTAYFGRSDYLGVDMNPHYIADARRRHARDFVVADVTTYTVETTQPFDFILVNSLLHHLATSDVRRLLNHLSTLLTADGAIHILDLVLPARQSLSRLLARWDRGDFARPPDVWRVLFTESFDPILVEPYRLGIPGLTLWNMVYFKGRARRPAVHA